MPQSHRVFVTGGTGYIGKRLIPELFRRGHEVIALTREQSRSKLPPTCTPVIGDALDAESYRRSVQGADTFVHLVGVSHPSPRKADLFRKIDLKAGLEAIRVAADLKLPHFIYLSVAQPAPVMQSYLAIRAECEKALAASRLPATVLRPWYVLGPGHLWPYCLLPLYKVAEVVPRTRDSALRLGLVTLQQMIGALVRAVEEPAAAMRILSVTDIRGSGGARSAVHESLPV